jgi:hypothetical protein
MRDSPLSTDRAPHGAVADASPAAETPAASVPAWLAARRSRSQPVKSQPKAGDAPAESDPEIEFAELSDEDGVGDGRVGEGRVGDDRVGEGGVREVGVSNVRQTENGETEDGGTTGSAGKSETDRVDDAVDEKVSSGAIFTKATDGERSSRKPIAMPPLPPVPPPLPESAPVRMDPKTLVSALSNLADRPAEAVDTSWKGRVVGWVRSNTMAGLLVSLIVHSIALTTLAVIVIGGHTVNRALDIFGVIADPNESALSDIVLDSAMPLDPGRDAAALEFPDLTQLVSDNEMSFDPGDSLRGAVGGTGKGSGEGGEGDAMSVPPVNVPKYAVTKGSFSAWTEPRDPEPGRLYVIIIQVRLPSNAKSYRGSDLTGMVIGTDLYKQAIKFRADETFPVQDGVVQIRIPVPGAAKLVRDTIRIESKLLREKQTLQIEF